MNELLGQQAIYTCFYLFSSLITALFVSTSKGAYQTNKAVRNQITQRIDEQESSLQYYDWYSAV